MTCLAELDAVWALEPAVVIITAPTELHLPLALAAVRHGAHIFIEKPLSHSMDGLELLDAEARQKGLVTMVGCNMRFHPGPATVRRLLEEKALGTSCVLDCKRVLFCRGGALNRTTARATVHLLTRAARSSIVFMKSTWPAGILDLASWLHRQSCRRAHLASPPMEPRRS